MVKPADHACVLRQVWVGREISWVGVAGARAGIVHTLREGMTSNLRRSEHVQGQDGALGGALGPLLRDEFAIPPWPGGREPELAYLAGNSLGLIPLAAREAVLAELDDWASLAVEGHFAARTPWLAWHEQVRETAARLVGARPGETVCMTTLTVNLHLMMASFYRPTRERYRIVIEDSAPFRLLRETLPQPYHGTDRPYPHSALTGMTQILSVRGRVSAPV